MLELIQIEWTKSLYSTERQKGSRIRTSRGEGTHTSSDAVEDRNLKGGCEAQNDNSLGS